MSKLSSQACLAGVYSVQGQDIKGHSDAVLALDREPILHIRLSLLFLSLASNRRWVCSRNLALPLSPHTIRPDSA